MGDKTGIEYLDATWNPIKGCSHESVGCKKCWAERMAARYAKPGEAFHGLTVEGAWTSVIKLYPHELSKPPRWKKPRRIGVSFMGDLFHNNADWQDQAAVFGSMLLSPQHQFLLLTKRPWRILHFFSFISKIRGNGSSLIKSWCRDNGVSTDLSPAQLCVEIARRKTADPIFDVEMAKGLEIAPKNAWFGISAENQEMARARVDVLMSVPCYHRWLSLEPLLGPISVDKAMYGDDDEGRGLSAFGFTDGVGHEAFIDFVVVGGESGPGYRPMDLEWARSLRDECAMAKVPFFFKQVAGKGFIPEDLRVQQLPKGLELTTSSTKAQGDGQGKATGARSGIRVPKL